MAIAAAEVPRMTKQGHLKVPGEAAVSWTLHRNVKRGLQQEYQLLFKNTEQRAAHLPARQSTNTFKKERKVHTTQAPHTTTPSPTERRERTNELTNE